ncbi:glutamate 5-kinase, partial [Acinetobacter baumannii]
MGLRDEIQADIDEAFNEDLADAVHSFTCERISRKDWDPKTETYVEVKENYSGRGVLFGSYSQYEIQTLGVLATDKKATVLQNEVSMTPKIEDEWLTALGSFRV